MGGLATIVPVYLSEIAPKNFTLGAWFMVAINVGFVLTSIFGQSWLINTTNLWPWSLLIGSFFYGIAFIGLFFSCESPDFLDGRGRVDEAKEQKSLQEGFIQILIGKLMIFE